MLPTIQIGPLAIPAPAFILLIGLWIGLSIAEQRATRFHYKKGVLFNLVTLTLVSGVVAARLGYVARYPSAFIDSPFDVISRNPGLLDPFAGAFAGGLAGLIYIQRRSLSVLATLDALTPALAVMGVALGLAHLASGDAYGSTTTLPWGITVWGAYRHPSQIYETLAAAIILFLTLSGKKLASIDRAGVIFWNFLAMSAFARLILEAFRGDSQIILLGIRSIQLISWLVMAFCFWFLAKLSRESDDNRR